MKSPAAPVRGFAPSRRLALAGFALVAITLIAAGLTIWDRREETIASYQREITNLGTVLAEQTARSMQAVDLVLKEVQAKAVAAGARTPQEFKRVMGSEEIHRLLVTRQETLPQAGAVGIVGADGTLINTSRGWPVPALDVSDREHFLYLRDHNDGGVFVSAPTRARLTGE